jgi:hypothetical protein
LTEQTTLPTNMAPGVVDEYAHDTDKRNRAELRDDKHRERLTDCLDYDTAAQFEQRKKTHKFNVSCQIIREDDRTGRRVPERPEHVVTAQNESDAWSQFCEILGVYPPPNQCKRIIERVNPRRN